MYIIMGQAILSLKDVVPTIFRLKKIPSDIIATALGIPTIIVSLGLMIIKKIKKI